MQNKFFLILLAMYLSLGAHAQESAIDKEAESPNFVHAYILDITPGKAFYSVYGHNALRLVCPSKHLDYCFTFEMDMNKSSYLSVFTRKAKAGFAIAPTSVFFGNYKEEGRGITQYELNLTPKQKQELWKVLDEEVAQGAIWDFNYTSINCLSMVFYAINKATAPENIIFPKLPSIIKGDYTVWMDYVSRRSPWVRLIMRTVLHGVDGNSIAPEDKLSSEMVKEVLPSAAIIDGNGHAKSLTKGKPQIVQEASYHDAPCWFTPTMAFAILVVFILFLGAFCYRQHNKKRMYQHQRNKNYE